MNLLVRIAQIFLFSILVVLIFASGANAGSSKVINATVGVSICGNALIEAPGEDCEGSDLGGATCTSQGYGAGTLSCDISCSFDYSLCSSPTPSPSASPTPTPTTTSAEAPTSSPTLVETVEASPTTVPINIISPSLPGPIRRFDPNGDGKIEPQEVYTSVASWVANWSASLTAIVQEDKSQKISTTASLANCDVNLDGACDLADLSILLYYINR